VAFSHGAAIRTWAGARAANIDGHFAAAHPLGNTALVEVHGDFETGLDVRWRGPTGPWAAPTSSTASRRTPTGERLLAG
jgi:probable phosphoglycerate mutase